MKERNWDWRDNSVAKYLFRMHETPISIPGTEKEEGEKRLLGGYGSKPVRPALGK